MLRQAVLAIHMALAAGSCVAPATPLPDTAALQAKNLDLQNEKLQLEINDLKEHGAFHIDQAVVSFIAAFLAAGTALSVPFVAGWRQSRSDRRMHLRTAFADFAAEYASAMHSMQWFTWKPANRLTLGGTDLESYDKEMHTAFPLLFSSLLKASALDSELYALLRPYFDDVVDCDVRECRDQSPTDASRCGLQREAKGCAFKVT
jgi:hypothetical protein